MKKIISKSLFFLMIAASLLLLVYMGIKTCKYVCADLDDAMVVETFYKSDSEVLGGVKLVEGSYENIKITTPEDLRIAEVFI